MSLINVIIPSPSGTTSGVGQIIKVLIDSPQNVLQVLHLYRTHPESDSTFIAFLKEPNSIFQVTAIINDRGTMFGYSGEGARGYGAIRSVIENLNINFQQHEWQDFLNARECKGRPFKKWNDKPESTVAYIKQWEELLTERYYVSFCSSLPSELYTFEHFNEHWKNRWSNMEVRKK